MKRIFITLLSIMALSLAACGTDEKASDGSDGTSGNPANQAEQNTNTMEGGEQAGVTTDQMKAEMDKLTFKEIDIEVSYGKDTEYEAKIEQDEGEPIEAEVEDELNGVYLNGQDAFDDLYPKVKQLNLTKDSSKEETIDQVLKVFDLKNDYKKFEVDITFNDGSKLDIEDRK